MRFLSVAFIHLCQTLDNAKYIVWLARVEQKIAKIGNSAGCFMHFGFQCREVDRELRQRSCLYQRCYLIAMPFLFS